MELREGLSEVDSDLIRGVKYLDTDLADIEHEYEEKGPLIYGDIEISEDVKTLMKLDPKLATLGRIEMKEVKAEVELLMTKIRYNRMNKEEESDEDEESESENEDMSES